LRPPKGLTEYEDREEEGDPGTEEIEERRPVRSGDEDPGHRNPPT
jgi:hypothetical protein